MSVKFNRGTKRPDHIDRFASISEEMREFPSHPGGSGPSQRAGLSYLQTQSMNQAAVAHEGHYPEAQVDDLAFGKMRAQDVEGLLRCLPMIARKNLGEPNRRLFLTRVSFRLVSKLGNSATSSSVSPCCLAKANRAPIHKLHSFFSATLRRASSVNFMLTEPRVVLTKRK